MEAESRRQILLAALVVLLAAAIYWAWPGTGAPPAQPPSATARVPASGAAPGTTASGRPSAAGEAPQVRLTALSAERPKPGDTERNLFRFKTTSRPVTSPAPVLAGPRPSTAVGPPAPTGPPPITLKFIGIVERREKSERIAVLRDTVGHIFYGGEGEIVEGRYRIVRIGAESIELSYLDGQGRQTIRLTGS